MAQRHFYIGQLRQFKMHISDWVVYKRHLLNYFTANEIDSVERRRAILLSMLDEDAYTFMVDLCSPDLPECTPFSTLVSLFDERFAPRRLLFGERYKFYKAKKCEYESVQDWAARVKKLGEYCEFGGDIEMCLRDKFIVGLGEQGIFNVLEDNVNMSFDETVKLVEEYMRDNYYYNKLYCYNGFDQMVEDIFNYFQSYSIPWYRLYNSMFYEDFY